MYAVQKIDYYLNKYFNMQMIINEFMFRSYKLPSSIICDGGVFAYRKLSVENQLHKICSI
jgi:hypothetical protein